MVTYVAVPRQLRNTKFEPKAKKSILVEYAMATKGYRIGLPDTNKIVGTINVRFSEEATTPKDIYVENEQGTTYYIGTGTFTSLEQHIWEHTSDITASEAIWDHTY